VLLWFAALMLRWSPRGIAVCGLGLPGYTANALSSGVVDRGSRRRLLQVPVWSPWWEGTSRLGFTIFAARARNVLGATG
jgi:hypothetical protein